MSSSTSTATAAGYEGAEGGGGPESGGGWRLSTYLHHLRVWHRLQEALAAPPAAPTSSMSSATSSSSLAALPGLQRGTGDLAARSMEVSGAPAHARTRHGLRRRRFGNAAAGRGGPGGLPGSSPSDSRQGETLLRPPEMPPVPEAEDDNVAAAAPPVQPTIPRALRPRLRASLDLLRDSLRLYGPENVYVSFNGGKDATISLSLYLAALAAHYSTAAADRPDFCLARPGAVVGGSGDDGGEVHTPAEKEADGKEGGSVRTPWPRPRAIYFDTSPTGEDAFPEQEVFFRKSVDANDLDLMRFYGSYQKAMPEFSEVAERRRKEDEMKRLGDTDGFAPNGKGSGHPLVILGVRRGDFDVTAFERNPVYVMQPSSSWIRGSAFMRCHPVLDWEYGDVWAYIDFLQLPYCRLYDLGFTSLGAPNATSPNVYLRSPSGHWLSARELRREEWSSERSGR